MPRRPVSVEVQFTSVLNARPGDGTMPAMVFPPLMPVHEKSPWHRSEEHTSELQSLRHLVCRLLLEKKKIATVVAKIIATVHRCRSMTDALLCAPAQTIALITLTNKVTSCKRRHTLRDMASARRSLT